MEHLLGPRDNRASRRTLTIFNWFLALYWHHLRAVASWFRPVGGVLTDRAFGLCRLRLPPGWRPARQLNEEAGLEATHPLLGRHVIIISESLADFAAGMTIDEHAARTLKQLTGSIQVLAVTGPDRRRVGGFEALQFEVEGFYEGACFRYLHSTIAGRRAFHQVIAWATCSRYDRASLERLLDGFAEPRGPIPSPRTPPPPTPVPPDSAYTVH